MVAAVQTSGLVNQLDVASWKHPGRSPPSESTLQAADLVEGMRRAGPISSVVARIDSEEERAEHEDDNVEDEDRGVGARCPHESSDNTGWDEHSIDERQAGRASRSFKGHGALSDVDTNQNNSRLNGTQRPLSSRTALFVLT